MPLANLTKQIHIHFTLQKRYKIGEKEEKKQLILRKKETRQHKNRVKQKEKQIHKRLVYICYINVKCWVLFL
jgi:hypothetical protein